MYIGKQPLIGNFQICDAISTVNGQAAYTLQVGGVNVSPETVNNMIVSVNGIIQKPGVSFDVAGSTITFTSNLVTGDIINFIQILGSVLDLGIVSDNTVTTAKIVDGAVTTAKIVDGAVTAAKLASGVGGITGADQWRLTTNFTGDANPIASNLERNDTTGAGFIGTAMSQSSGIFSFPSTGIWHISFLVNSSYNGENRYCQAKIQTTVDNSSYIDASISEQGISTSSGGTVYASQFADTIFDVTNTSNCKIKFYIDNEDNSTTVLGSSTKDATCFRFIRLGDT